MADEQAREASGESFFKMVGEAVISALEKVREIDQKNRHDLFGDGILKAAGRQGIDELGMALKAFPEAVQAHEPGAIWNPTQGEIASDRKPGRMPTPSELAADDRPYEPERGHGQSQEHGHGR
jgi:hypothetical protein